MLTSALGSFDDLQVADIFAGTGALGLEAMSRGADHCTFVESNRKAIAALKANIDTVSAQDRVTIFSRTAPRIGRLARPVNLAFLDAPYRAGLTEPTLAALLDNGWLGLGATIVVETAAGDHPNAPGYAVLSERAFGAAQVTLLRPTGTS